MQANVSEINRTNNGLRKIDKLKIFRRRFRLLSGILKILKLNNVVKFDKLNKYQFFIIFLKR